MTLAEAVATAGGLLDLQADPGSVFLYRREPRALAEKLGVDCSKMDGPTVPIVYSVSFVDPAGYFLATRVQMHNKDVLFAANAQSVDIVKFTAFLNALISVPANGVGLANELQENRILFHTPNPTTTTTSPVVTSTTVVTTPAPHSLMGLLPIGVNTERRAAWQFRGPARISRLMSTGTFLSPTATSLRHECRCITRTYSSPPMRSRLRSRSLRHS
jgi:hypothetical protein